MLYILTEDAIFHKSFITPAEQETYLGFLKNLQLYGRMLKEHPSHRKVFQRFRTEYVLRV